MPYEHQTLRLPYKNRTCQTCVILPVQQVQAPQLPVHISYFLQKCNKGKPDEMDLPLLENDITTIFYRYDTCDLLQ
jgi:hypothetical protein